MSFRRIIIAVAGFISLGLAALGWWCPNCQPWLKWTALALFGVAGLVTLALAVFGSSKQVNVFYGEARKEIEPFPPEDTKQ